MIKYECKYPYFKLNGTLRDNGNDTSTQPILALVSIVDDIYGFIPSDSQKNMIDVIVPNKTKDIDELKELCAITAIQFVADNYKTKNEKTKL